MVVKKEAKTEIFTVLLEKLVVRLESMRIAEYMELLEHPGKLILINFIAGLARGLGIALGATVIVAILLEILRQLLLLNIPGIGNFIADIVQIVEKKNGNF